MYHPAHLGKISQALPSIAEFMGFSNHHMTALNMPVESFHSVDMLTFYNAMSTLVQNSQDLQNELQDDIG